VVWTESDIAVAFDLVNNFAGTTPEIANQFFQQYLTNLLGDILYVLTDADHKSGMSPVKYAGLG
jgi:exportin-1